MNDGTGSVILIDVKTRTDNSSGLRSSVFDLVCSQNGLRGIVDDLTRVLGLPVDVLLLGESGTGKELIARALHEADPVKHAHRFVAVNYATLAENLLEADLFGYLRGAFTGATDDLEGLFQQAHVLDMRVVSATNRDLGAAIAGNRFRRDLYFRLADFVIRLPPLRERRGDIPQLADHFLDLYRRQLVRPHIDALGEGAKAWLRRCDWRANNVRELSVVMKRAVLLCDSPVLTAQHLWSAMSRGALDSSQRPPDIIDEHTRLKDAMQLTDGNLSAAARNLGMKRSTLHDRLQRHGIRRVAQS